VNDQHARVPRWPYLLCRATSAVVALLAVAQAAFAGGFLSGHYDMLRMHLVTAATMVAASVVQAVGVVFLRRAGGPRSVLLLGLAFPLILATQGALGMGRVVGLHVPLGVLVAVGALRLSAWVWRSPLPVRAGASGPTRRPVGALS
jgi:hypothetical protein